MLQDMRKYASSWIIKILLGIIVIVFIFFFGAGSFQRRPDQHVAVINGQQISREEYQTAYNNLVQEMRQRFGDNLNDNMLKMLNVKKQAMDRLIAQTIIRQEADQIGIKVTKKELKDAIRNMAVFHTNGGFNKVTYKRLLERIQMSPEKFEAEQKRLMLTNKLQALVIDSIKVSEHEAKSWYEWENTQVDINFVQIDPKKIEDITPTEEEIAEYFEKNKDRYKTEPQVKVRYLKFSPDTYKSEVSLSNEDIEDYYIENQNKFAKPKTVEARHILIKVTPSASDEEVEKARKKTADILVKARKKGQDFAELAKKYSEGPTKTNGGYLGEFKKEAMVPPFSDKAFSMESGEISDLVRTDFGWHIIKVEKVNEAHTLTLAEAEPEIRKSIITEKTKNLAYDDALMIYEMSIDGDDLVKASKENDLEIQTTDFFTRRQGPKIQIQDRSKFISTAFDLPEMEISDILEIGNNYYLMQVTEKMLPKISDLADVKDKVSQDLVKEMKDKKASEKAEALLASLKSGGQIAEEAEKSGLEIKTTDFFSRSGSIPVIGRDQNISKAAFLLHEGNKLPENVLKGRNGYYVIEFKGRKLPDPEGFEKEKSSILKKIEQQKKAEAFELWISALKEKSEITIEPEFI